MALFVGASNKLLSSCQVQPSAMEANEYPAYTAIKIYPYQYFQMYSQQRGTKASTLDYTTAINKRVTPGRCLMHSSQLETIYEIFKGKNADSSCLSVVVGIDAHTCICSTSSK